MFTIGDTVVYKGHGLVKVVGIPHQRMTDSSGTVVGSDTYYVLHSARTPLAATKLMVRTQGAERVLRFPVSAEEAKRMIATAGEEAAELPEDHKERMRIIDAVVEKNEWNELAALVRDYRESKLTNLERDEVKRIKAVARNLAEEICHILKTNRPALHGKFSIRSVI
jgi:RNA polymerase-interacting CarD/CdnL/TRCF family regulator